MTKEQALRLMDILANAFGSTKPMIERPDLMEALTRLRTEVAEAPTLIQQIQRERDLSLINVGPSLS